MKEENDIERLFQSSFADFEVAPPDAVKTAIDKQLSGSKKRRFFWLFTGMSLIVIALVAFLFMPSTNQITTSKKAIHNTFTTNNESMANVDITDSELQTKNQVLQPPKFRFNIKQNYNQPLSVKTRKLDDLTTMNEVIPYRWEEPIGNRLNKKNVAENLKKQVVVNRKGSVSAGSEKNSLLDSTKRIEKKKLWLVGVNGGPSFGFGEVPNVMKHKSKVGFQGSLELYRKISLGNLSGVGIGTTYNQFSELYTSSTTTDSIYFVGVDTVLVYGNPQFPDSVTGVNYIQNYDTTTTVTNLSSEARVSRISFSLQTQFSFPFNSNIGLNVTPGIAYARNTFRFDTALSEEKVSSIQFKTALEFYYDRNKWRFSAGIDCRYEFFSESTSPFIQDRKRFQITPQVGVGFRF